MKLNARGEVTQKYRNWSNSSCECARIAKGSLRTRCFSSSQFVTSK